MKIRRLNDDEIKNLPFEMQVCYMLQSWNNNIDPKTPKEWAEVIGFFNYKKQGASNKDPSGINKALNDALYHIDYIKRFILKNL